MANGIPVSVEQDLRTAIELLDQAHRLIQQHSTAVETEQWESLLNARSLIQEGISCVYRVLPPRVNPVKVIVPLEFDAKTLIYCLH